MLTLKLSYVNWPGAPYRWTYEWNGTGVSGPAYFRDETQEDVEKRVGGTFGKGLTLYEDDGSEGASVYVKRPFENSTEYAIWKLNEIHGKLAADFDPNRVHFEGEPAEDIVSWIGGVRQVTALGEVHPTGEALVDAVNGRDRRFAYLCGPGDPGIEIHTWMGPDKKTVRKVIMVIFDNAPTRVMLVERAWLLGPSGDTIQKIAP